jgi:hypothetical protein
MKIRLAFRRMFLEPGKTFAVPTAAGARVRVVDGMVWATTSSSPDDVWLGAGEEHTISRPGLTVVESLARSTVELFPPVATGIRARLISRYEMGIPKLACNLAAVAMAAITIGVLVVLPAALEAHHPSRAPMASAADTVPARIASQPRAALEPPRERIAQAWSAPPPTRAQ